MGTPFSDITLYIPTTFNVGTAEYIEEVSLQNFVSDLYVQKMNGYKPPKTTRITIQPAFHDNWKRTWKNGSVIAIAPYFNVIEYAPLDKPGKYKSILELIQNATLPLSEEYGWDKTVFERAYEEVIKDNFQFEKCYPSKKSRDKKKLGTFCIEKSETITSACIKIEADGSEIKKKLFEKKNGWWYDGVYALARCNKWIDTDRFGIEYGKGILKILYSIQQNEVELYENGKRVEQIDFEKYFPFG